MFKLIHVIEYCTWLFVVAMENSEISESEIQNPSFLFVKVALMINIFWQSNILRGPDRYMPEIDDDTKSICYSSFTGYYKYL
jgi:hypothetical protein